jgi:hypothetical protein
MLHTIQTYHRISHQIVPRGFCVIGNLATNHYVTLSVSSTDMRVAFEQKYVETGKRRWISCKGLVDLLCDRTVQP